MILFFDIETTGLTPKDAEWKTHPHLFPDIVSLSFIVQNDDPIIIRQYSQIIKPSGWTIPEDVVKLHGITNERAQLEGIELLIALKEFLTWAALCDKHVAHNIHFDARIIKASCMKSGIPIESFDTVLDKSKRFDTMSKSMKHVGATRLNKNNKPVPKFPTLQELYNKLFNKDFDGVHQSDKDAWACMECYNEMVRIKLVA